MFHFVLVDTNIWVHKSKLLRTPLGASLVYSLRRSHRKILLPEVVELEVRRNTELLATELVKEATERLDDLRYLLERPLEVDLPDSETAARDVVDRLEELEAIIERWPFTLTQARSALLRVVDKRPPSVGGQQFKDCAIWEAALEAAANHPVCIVTEDKGFFEEKREANGLWRDLIREADAKPNPVLIYYGLKRYLEEHGVRAPPLPEQRLAGLIEEEARGTIEWKSEGQGVVLRDLVELSSTPFLSGDPDDVVYGFSVVFRATLENPDGGPPYEGTMHAEGEMVYEPERDSVDDVELSSIWFHDEFGKRMGGGSLVDEKTPQQGSWAAWKPVYTIRHRLE